MADIVHDVPNEMIYIMYPILVLVGVLAITDFLYHMVALGWYTFLARNVSPILAKQIESLPKGDKRYRMSRMVEAWKFGSGLDYDDHK
jgi:hypothetical protein